MKKKLQELLIKYDENVSFEKAMEVNSLLDELLDNYSKLTNEDINLLVNYQDEDGGFKLTNYRSFKGEQALDVYFYPSYIISLILINVSLDNIYNVNKEIIKKSLDFCVLNEFVGHGYDSFETQLDTVILFGKYRIKEYINKNNLSNSKINKLFINLLEQYEEMIANNNTIVGWEVDVKDKLIRAIELLDDSIYYLAYGSNLNKKQMKHRCKDSICIGSSILENYKLKFNLYLTIEKEEGSIVPVGIYKISKEDEKALDRYEGYPYIYRKEYINVKVNNINRKCIVYIMNDIPSRKDVKPTKEYFDRCKEGYNDFNLDIRYLLKALGKYFLAKELTDDELKLLDIIPLKEELVNKLSEQEILEKIKELFIKRGIYDDWKKQLANYEEYSCLDLIKLILVYPGMSRDSIMLSFYPLQ